MSRLPLLLALACSAAAAEPRYDNLVDLKSIDPTIRRRAPLRHGAESDRARPLSAGTPALVRPSTAARLARAQKFLRTRGYGLKIWDAYRPLAAQMELWQRTHAGTFVADPFEGDGSLHTWGVAVDATLVDAKGRAVSMPTDFDDFSPAARLHYRGDDPVVMFHLKLLQRAMRHGGFYGQRNEWWHFTAYDWKKYAPIREAKRIN